jgi:hypothetical protein
MSFCKNCGWWKNFDCIFEFSVKSYVRNPINLSCAKILFLSVMWNLFCPLCRFRGLLERMSCEMEALSWVRKLSRSLCYWSSINYANLSDITKLIQLQQMRLLAKRNGIQLTFCLWVSIELRTQLIKKNTQ